MAKHAVDTTQKKQNKQLSIVAVFNPFNVFTDSTPYAIVIYNPRFFKSCTKFT